MDRLLRLCFAFFSLFLDRNRFSRRIFCPESSSLAKLRVSWLLFDAPQRILYPLLALRSSGPHFSSYPGCCCRFSFSFSESVNSPMAPVKEAKLKAAALLPRKMTQTKLTSKGKGKTDANGATPEVKEQKIRVQNKGLGSEKVGTPKQVFSYGAELAAAAAVSKDVNPGRVRVLKDGIVGVQGPVVYWVSRDQRSRDNWALLHAVEQARRRETSVAVVFNLVDSFLRAQARQFGFLLRGLRVMERNLMAVGIPFFLFRGKPEETIPAFVRSIEASLLVMDYSPLRIGRAWREAVCNELEPAVAVHEVDSHNVVPVWVASPKLEYGARTIRSKIQKLLPEFLVEFPVLENPGKPWAAQIPPPLDWDSLIEEVLSVGAEVPEVDWCEAGEDAALEALVGEKGFLRSRIKNYEDNRNDPSKTGALSGLSPYLHYGHVSAQRCALEARKARRSHTKAADAFLEELVIRRELADNYCHYQLNYDNLKGAWDWARKTLTDHASDKREHIYTLEELEKGRTYDQLWNASQLEMVHYGKMHGFMRMYWAKKILEWTPSPEEALSAAIYLNDKYELDGRDPNGYVGCMWSICGVHDQGWQERPVFGKIRYMNYAGCKRKFNVEGYILYVNRLVAEIKKKQKASNIGSLVP